MKKFKIVWIGWNGPRPEPEESIYLGQTEEARVSDGKRWAVRAAGQSRQDFIGEVAEFIKQEGYGAL
jgi:hypothetical protein